jgi:D-alanyl-lipoteichoic acid acyltransferase DltB (MBOAT superfamily)
MLFNSYEFIFFFLPITLIVFSFIGNFGRKRTSILWLVGTSLFYYAWWNPAYLWLISASIISNYAFGIILSKQSTHNRLSKKTILASGIFLNLLLLGYFKYANFFFDNISSMLGQATHIETIILPVAISFFTFQQIAYLVDAYEGKAQEYSFLHYCLFVTFFPQLICGPINHHKDMMPQFENDSTYKLRSANIAVGMTFFLIGLFKKVVLADGVAVYSVPGFEAAEHGVLLTFIEAWGCALAYTFQIYFDFSGYSDMAIGLGRMFGIHLPLNFHSPYKAVNIIEFWRRWHITLSRFLRDYLYIPLGGNRRGPSRRYLNLMVVMILGGLWHGAGWTFVAWGTLHGLYLVINNGWHAACRALGHDTERSTWWGRRLSQAVTFTAVVFAWVLFRADSFNGAQNIIYGMLGSNGIAIPESYLGGFNQVNSIKNLFISLGWEFRNIEFFYGKTEAVSLLLLFLISMGGPNTQQIMLRYHSVLESQRVQVQAWRWNFVRWSPNSICFVFILSITVFSLYRMMSHGYKEFIYRFF